MTFDDKLAVGQAGESAIARWLRKRGYSIVPVYEKIMDTGKGPQLFTPTSKLIAPDMFAFNGDKALWIEAKTKSAFAWHRISSSWTTGIDLAHYEDYLMVDDLSPWPVWLLFLQRGGQAKDSPPNSPSGLFGNTLSRLRHTENHRHANWGPTGMVYWDIDALLLIAPLDEVV